MTLYILKKMEGTVTETVPLHALRLRIGRGVSNELRFDDLSVAFDHAIIEKQETGYILTDLNPSPESYVNGRPVRSLLLHDGDRIKIGSRQITFRCPEADPPILEIVEVEAPTSSGKPLVEAVIVDYVARYTLFGRGLSPWIVALPTALIILFGMGGYLANRQSNAMPGLLAGGHALLARDCTWCHTPWAPVREKPCLGCHTMGGHYQADRITFSTQDCLNCHREHHGESLRRAMLGAVQPMAGADPDCVRCHGNLKAHFPRSSSTPSIRNFGQDHPEFSVHLGDVGKPLPQRIRLNAKTGLSDPGRLKMNHKIHLDPELTGLDGQGPLTCARCHLLDDDGKRMRPVRFDPACVSCHALDFDARLPDARIPHGKQSREIDAWLRAFYKDLSPTHTEKTMTADSVEAMTQRAENTLFGKSRRKDMQGKCMECHVLDHTADGMAVSVEESLPLSIATVQVPRRWFVNAVFDHTPHALLQCVACHTTALLSETAKDILLPGIGLCRACHMEERAAGQKWISTPCTGCHAYHNQRPPTQTDGPYTLNSLLKRPFQQTVVSP